MNTLADQSRIWIYQSNQPFPSSEIENIKTHLQSFCTSWTSHNRWLKADGAILHDRFIVLMVDETQAGASGCSIDKSVHFIQSLEAKYGVNMFDRMLFAYQQDGEIKTAHRDEFSNLYAQNIINDETLVFDNLVKTKADFEQGWVKPLSQSWHKRMV